MLVALLALLATEEDDLVGAGAAHPFAALVALHQDFHFLAQVPAVQLAPDALSNAETYTYNAKNPTFTPYGSYLPVPPDMKTTSQYSWNLGIQRQMTPSWFLSGTYVGTHLTHIWNAFELNPALFLGLGPCTLNTATGPVTYSTCSTASNVNQRRLLNLANPQANLGYLTLYDDGGTSGYNGLLLDTRIRAGQNLNLNVN